MTKKEKKEEVIKCVGIVHTQYVQVNVPTSFAGDTADALAQALLTDYYSHYLAQNRVTEDE
jgi:hypothetical protein